LADIRTLADHLNISIGTVSRALNNRAGVNAETRKRVLDAATALGYVANQSGRSLRRGATNTIGFVVETGEPANQSGDNFFFVLVDAMNEVLAERGYDLVILPCHSADDPVEFLQRVIARGTVDAIVITATRRQDRRIALLAQSAMPFLTLGRSETEGVYPWIDLDFEGVARRSVSELAAAGHRRIAVAVPDSDVALGTHFRRGYLDGLAEAGLDPDEALILRVPSSEAGGVEFGRRVVAMNPRPTAALICSEIATVGLYVALASAGLHPGADMSVVAFRDNAQVRFLRPAPACFHVDIPALGRTLAEMVLELVQNDPDQVREKHRIWQMDFVPGATILPPHQG
jgi:DNA-binding LacI/PurR family transcriptional regulator